MHCFSNKSGEVGYCTNNNNFICILVFIAHVTYASFSQSSVQGVLELHYVA